MAFSSHQIFLNSWSISEDLVVSYPQGERHNGSFQLLELAELEEEKCNFESSWEESPSSH